MAQCGRRGDSLREETWLSLGGEVAHGGWRGDSMAGGEVAQWWVER